MRNVGGTADFLTLWFSDFLIFLETIVRILKSSSRCKSEMSGGKKRLLVWQVQLSYQIFRCMGRRCHWAGAPARHLPLPSRHQPPRHRLLYQGLHNSSILAFTLASSNGLTLQKMPFVLSNPGSMEGRPRRNLPTKKPWTRRPGKNKKQPKDFHPSPREADLIAIDQNEVVHIYLMGEHSG